MNWHSPGTFTQWFMRWSSLANIGFICFTVTFLFFGIYFHWPEQVLGAYLSSINAKRPETGNIWKAGKSIMTAKAHIAQIIKYRKDLRLNVLQTDSFSELAQNLAPEQWVKIEKETLIRLYQALPEKQAHRLINPMHLAWLVKTDAAKQILCLGKPQSMSIYFMDSNRQAIGKIDFSSSTLDDIQISGKATKTSLDNLLEFKNNIYPAKSFFQAVLKLPDDMIKNLMENPEILISQMGTLKRVGISNQSESGYVMIGFEFQDKEEVKIIQSKAKEWAIWQLGLFLQEDKL